MAIGTGGMFRVTLPFTTQTTGTSLYDDTNLFRAHDIDRSLDLLNKDTGAFTRILDAFSTKEPVEQMIHWWVEDDILPNSTQVNYSAGYSATDTSIVVDDAKLFIKYSLVVVARTMENLFVTEVNNGSNTLTVTRGAAGTAAAALVDNDILVAGHVALPEQGGANGGNSQVPTTKQYNFCSAFSETVKVTEFQDVAAMVETGQGKVATIEWAVANKWFDVKRKINCALIFQHRGTISTDDGTVYLSQGFAHYVDNNVFNLGDDNTLLTWPDLSDWLDSLFDYTESSKEKVAFVGNYLFGAINRMQRDMGAEATKYFEPVVDEEVIRVITEGGNTVTFIRDKYGFDSAYGWAGWGIVADMAYVFKREHKGMPMQWRRNIQDNDAHERKDEIYGSFLLEVRHPRLHGLIRGAARSIIDR